MANHAERGAWTLVLAFCCAALSGHAQYYVNGLSLSDAPGIDQFDEQHVLLDHVPPPASNELKIGPNTGLYTFRSNGRVTIRDYFKVSCLPGTTSANRAIIGASNQRLAAELLVGTYTNMPEYELMEWGVRLDVSEGLGNIQDRIDAFFADQALFQPQWKPGTTAYDEAFKNGLMINPYDPAHISVDLVLYRPSSPHTAPVIRYGFYKGLDYDLLDPDSPGDPVTNPWVTLHGPPYPWRVRFAPDEVGHWAGFINVWIGPQNDGMGSRRCPETYGFGFDVDNAAGEEGYVIVSPDQPDYLVYHGSGRQYVPCGQNYAWPKEYWDGCVSGNCVNIHDHRMRPSVRAELQTFVKNFSHGGHGEQTGNATRTFFTTWGFMVEREHLGDYSTRDIEMSELDRYFETLEKNGMKTWFSFGEIDYADGEKHSVGSAGNWVYNQGWWWNPYNDPADPNEPSDHHDHDPNQHHKGISGVHTPYDFVTNPQALQFYKNRIRYIDARWGYSKALLGYDWNEVNLAGLWDGGSTDPGSHYPGFKNWLKRLTSYIKQGLHSPHLTSIGVAEIRMANDVDANAILSLYTDLPDVNVVSDHVYGNGEGTDRVASQHLDWIRTAAPPITKPMLIEESGTWEYEAVNLCTDLHVHNAAWSGALSGVAGPPFVWPWRRYTLPYVTVDWSVGNQSSDPPYYGTGGPYHGEYEHNYPGLRSFIEEMDAAHHAYRYYNAGHFSDPNPTRYMFDAGQNQSKQYEVYSAVRADKQLAFGWVHDRSSIAYNYGGDCCNQVVNNNSGPVLMNITDVRTMSPLSGNDLPQSTDNHCIDQDGCDNVPMSGNCGTLVDVNYWDPYCNAGSYDVVGYVSVAGWPANVYQIHPGGPDLVAVYGLEANTPYYLRWVDTWGADCGNTTVHPLQGLMTDAQGRALIDPPPTGPVSSKELYPGDWAFKLTTDSHGGNPKSTALRFDASEDHEGIRVHFSAPFTGMLAVYDVSGRLVIDGAALTDATDGFIPARLTTGVYSIRAVDAQGVLHYAKVQMTALR